MQLDCIGATNQNRCFPDLAWTVWIIQNPFNQALTPKGIAWFIDPNESTKKLNAAGCLIGGLNTAKQTCKQCTLAVGS